MAFSAKSPALVIVYLDDKGKYSTQRINLEQGRDLSMNDLDEAARDIQTELDALTDCQIVSVSASIPLTLTGGLKSAPVANSDVEETAKFIFETEDGFFTEQTIPGFKESLLLENSRKVDIDASAVANFIDEMVDGLDDAGISDPIDCTDQRGSVITGVREAFELFKKSRR